MFITKFSSVHLLYILNYYNFLWKKLNLRKAEMMLSNFLLRLMDDVCIFQL